MIAAAGIVGVILVAVPLLILVGNDQDQQAEDHTVAAADSSTRGEQPGVPLPPPGARATEKPKGGSSVIPPKAGGKGKDGASGRPGVNGGGGEVARPVGGGGPASSSSADARDAGDPQDAGDAGDAGEGASPKTTSPSGASPTVKPTPKAGTTVDEPVAIPTARIVNAATGKCLTAGSRTAGSALAIQPCGSSTATQTWAFHDQDHTLRIGENLCMELAGGSVSDGTTIQLQRCDGSGGQTFKINATEDLVSLKAGNKCADVWQGNTANGTPIRLWPCTGTANQTWRRG